LLFLETLHFIAVFEYVTWHDAFRVVRRSRTKQKASCQKINQLWW